MTGLVWTALPEYSGGLNRGVVYTNMDSVPWDGLTQIDESPVGGEVTSVYFDGVKTIEMVAAEDFSATITAYTYPDVIETLENIGKVFGFTYRTRTNLGELIHLVYNATIFHNAKSRKTFSDVPDPSIFSWALYATPTDVPSVRPTAHLVIDTSTANPSAVTRLENLLYGSSETDPRLPTTDEIVAIFSEYATLIVIDNGDGTWSATGPDEAIQMLDDTTFEITWPSAIYTGPDTYMISSF